MAEQNWEAVLKEPYDEDRAGLTVVCPTAPGYVDEPGIVFHSDWWLREHWGRAFEILEIDHPQAPSDGGEPLQQNFLLARKLPVSLTAVELQRVNPNESRELESLRTNVRVLLRQSPGLWAETCATCSTIPSACGAGSINWGRVAIDCVAGSIRWSRGSMSFSSGCVRHSHGFTGSSSCCARSQTAGAGG